MKGFRVSIKFVEQLMKTYHYLILWESMVLESCTPSYAQVIRMKRLSESDKLTPEAIEAIMMEEKTNQKGILLREEHFSRLFSPDLPMSKGEDYFHS